MAAGSARLPTRRDLWSCARRRQPTGPSLTRGRAGGGFFEPVVGRRGDDLVSSEQMRSMRSVRAGHPTTDVFVVERPVAPLSAPTGERSPIGLAAAAGVAEDLTIEPCSNRFDRWGRSRHPCLQPTSTTDRRQLAAVHRRERPRAKTRGLAATTVPARSMTSLKSTCTT